MVALVVVLGGGQTKAQLILNEIRPNRVPVDLRCKQDQGVHNLAMLKKGVHKLAMLKKRRAIPCNAQKKAFWHHGWRLRTAPSTRCSKQTQANIGLDLKFFTALQ